MIHLHCSSLWYFQLHRTEAQVGQGVQRNTALFSRLFMVFSLTRRFALFDGTCLACAPNLLTAFPPSIPHLCLLRTPGIFPTLGEAHKANVHAGDEGHDDQRGHKWKHPLVKVASERKADAEHRYFKECYLPPRIGV